MAQEVTRRTARRQGERGAELIEFALVLPLLMFILLGIFDFGFLFQRYEVLTNAAREGARLGTLPNYATADIQARVASYVTTGGLPGTATVNVQAVAIPTGGGTPATGVQVTVTYPHTFTFIGPIARWFGGSFGTITLTARSTMRSEIQGGAGS